LLGLVRRRTIKQADAEKKNADIAHANWKLDE